MEEGIPRASTSANTPITIKLILNISIASTPPKFAMFLLFFFFWFFFSSFSQRERNAICYTSAENKGLGLEGLKENVLSREQGDERGILKEMDSLSGFPNVGPLDCCHVCA